MRGRRRNDGFSLLELLVSIAVLLIVAGAAFSALNQSQKVYGSQQLQADMHAGLRSAFELMVQEIGQAGSLNFTPTTLVCPPPSNQCTGSGTAQTLTLGSTANIFVGEQLTVDTGASQEVVQVISLPGTNQVNGKFTLNHLNGVPIIAVGVFPQGVLTTTAGNSLQLFGDINADGTLAYVEYDCNPGTATAPGTLTRSYTLLAPGVTTKNQPQTLLNTLVYNPNNAQGVPTPCFTPSMGVGGNVTAGNCTGTFTCVTDMQVMLTVQTSEIDPQTHAPVQMTKSFLNISSRDVFAAYIIATSPNPAANLLQPTPPGLPLH